MGYLEFLGFFVGWIGMTIYMNYKEIKKSFNLFLEDNHPEELKGNKS